MIPSKRKTVQIVHRRVTDAAFSVAELTRWLDAVRRDLPAQYRDIARVSFEVEIDDVFDDGEVMMKDVFLNVDFVADTEAE